MNRLLTEGRGAFLRRVSGIQRGADCARYEPLLSALADGEASPEDLALLRSHMRTCLSCRAALREFRAMPERVASVLPATALAGGDGSGPLRSLVESLIGAAQHKTAAMGDRLQAAGELATGQQVAAMAASAAALAGGGTAIDELASHHPRARRTGGAAAEPAGCRSAGRAPAPGASARSAGYRGARAAGRTRVRAHATAARPGERVRPERRRAAQHDPTAAGPAAPEREHRLRGRRRRRLGKRKRIRQRRVRAVTRIAPATPGGVGVRT